MLGIVLAPYGQLPNGNYPYNITMSRGGDGHYMQPHDPQFYTRGEQGHYYDTPLGQPLTFMQKWKMRRYYKGLAKQAQALRVASPFLGFGAIPTDAELAYNRGYTPVESGWIATTNQGLIPGPWNPPNGWLQMGAYGPRIAPRTPMGLGDAAVPAAGPQLIPNDTPLPPPQMTTDDMMAALQAHNDRVFTLALVSTSAVAISALISIFRTTRLIRTEGRSRNSE